MRLALPDVQICAVSSVALEETLEALERSCRAVAFGDALLLSHERPSTLGKANIRWQRVEPVNSREAYSHFVLRDLLRYMTRPHILLVQWDGFVISPKQWLDEFLSYDYIGAPWPQFGDGLDVGNGGFSLRSRRLVELTAREDWPLAHPEDIAICRTWRPQLEAEAGVRFAPREIAERFSQERGRAGDSSFGFHGLFRFPDVLGASEVTRLAEKLGPRLVAGKDGADFILRLAESDARGLAWRMMVRRLSVRILSWPNIRLIIHLLGRTLGRGSAR